MRHRIKAAPDSVAAAAGYAAASIGRRASKERKSDTTGGRCDNDGRVHFLAGNNNNASFAGWRRLPVAVTAELRL